MALADAARDVKERRIPDEQFALRDVPVGVGEERGDRLGPPCIDEHLAQSTGT